MTVTRLTDRPDARISATGVKNAARAVRARCRKDGECLVWTGAKSSNFGQIDLKPYGRDARGYTHRIVFAAEFLDGDLGALDNLVVTPDCYADLEVVSHRCPLVRLRCQWRAGLVPS